MILIKRLLKPVARHPRRRSLRGDRRALYNDLIMHEWDRLATTVEAVPGELVTAWAELCDGYDDDALNAWSELLHVALLHPSWFLDGAPELDFPDAATLVREFIATQTGG